MPRDIDVHPDSNVSALVNGIIKDTEALIVQQFQLLKHEISEDIRRIAYGALTCITALGLGLVAFVVLALMLVQLLAVTEPAWPMWASYAIVGGALLIIALVLFFIGVATVSSIRATPEKSVQAFKENVQWLANPK